MSEVVFTPDPEAVRRSAMTGFARFWGERRGKVLGDDLALFRESVADVAGFWEAFVAWSGVRLSGDVSTVLTEGGVERALFYPNAALSFVSHLLDPPGGADPGALAVISLDETGHREELTFAALSERVRRVAAALVARGVRPGDRVLGLCRLTATTVICQLASLAIGAVWSSAAPDMGTELLLARAGQLDPKVLFADATYPYHGTTKDNRERIGGIVLSLPTLSRVVLLGPESGAIPDVGDVPVEPFGALAESAPFEGPFPEMPFNHPLVILFSSGTTGQPKCIVHGAGGTLLEHLKEHRLHCDLGPGDRLLYHTTTGWMMFNWLVSGLAAGATIVLYDGSVSHPEPDALLRRAAEAGVTVLGTSPVYLQYCRDAGLVPRTELDLRKLRLVLSTGSVLAEGQYDWVRENVGELPIHSISGGTDIVGCFVMGSPNRPVRRGESSSLGLALDVRAAVAGASGTEVLGIPSEGSVVGELVCAQPFPSRPVGLFGDADGSRLTAAYYAENPGLWTHGDTIEITAHGSARILGRSDGVLNVRGIRVGPGEIYRVLEGFPEIAAACAVEQRAPSEPGGSRIVLLVVLRESGTLARPLVLRIKKALSTRASAAHVPAVVAEVSDLPRTHNGKLSERAARDAANGAPAKNLLALRNPACLREIEAHPDVVAGREG